ncbi:hypothetical protein [Lysinibacillus sp. Bpr_S20]|uniref:hypothetical protein n=1 Tax=Lysinibacillus sp. Bpr_S20 TaxID=2933964 RepID=UPI002011858C|nr:hypothetical protein [Lysinibacillus sp. Bpr_S20]MCL1699910.1 hypothetical protein [Lysinibacillus sp. Bpr_S20]
MVFARKRSANVATAALWFFARKRSANVATAALWFFARKRSANVAAAALCWSLNRVLFLLLLCFLTDKLPQDVAFLH